MPTNVRDPRSIVTPDAFEVDESLLGIPLAQPNRRFFAITIDIVVIGVLTVLMSAFFSSFGVFVWGVVGVLILVTTIRRPPTGSMGTLVRVSVGCLGVFILTIVAIIGLVVILDGDDAPSRSPSTQAPSTGESAEGTPATPPEDGRISALSRFDTLQLSTDEVLGELARVVRAEATLSGDDTLEPSDTAGLRQRRDTLAALALDRDALERLALTSFRTDTFQTLDDLAEDLRDERDDAQRALRNTRAQLDREQNDFGSLLRDLWEQAGSAFGLWSIYFTVVLTATNGLTVGKKLMGVRVVRLDGEPLTWWTSFERGGGYVAGLATGLLGFAQLFWDANRQCIHDKVVGTVVVKDGAKPIPGAWKEAFGVSPRSTRPDADPLIHHD